ncbi:hypothetical protein C9I57_28190 [Trinickia symbiotica]|uniref:Plasmid pRiA4b Orf3-like domain-containing protein n=1 Tax=Trinickia symbiotica TaxID=863227 RepID=A0A2T3XLJ6_9BURK|nr:plasmid pRiA4b ORF-3 family protein [Trinickia symbiotica]PTB17392.1 hypothetical protein C9I57_28190 [Trinickia symbiotica]
MAKSYRLFTLHAQIRDIDPPISRRVQVQGGESLRKLHDILQAAFGWHDADLHEFEVNDKAYVVMDVGHMLEFMDSKKKFDDRKVKVSRCAATKCNNADKSGKNPCP